MTNRRTANGKTCFDIRKQFQRVNNDLIIRYCKMIDKMVEDGIIATREQYRDARREQDEKLNRLFEYAYKYANSVSAGLFSLHG